MSHELLMPVSGEVLEFNEELNTNPEIMNTDPYVKGWMIKVKFSDALELDALLNAEQYSNIVSA